MGGGLALPALLKQVPTENCTLYYTHQCPNPTKKVSETLPLKISSRLTNLVISQGIYKKERELKEK